MARVSSSLSPIVPARATRYTNVSYALGVEGGLSAQLKQEPLVAVQFELSELVDRHRVVPKALFILDQNFNASP